MNWICRRRSLSEAPARVNSSLWKIADMPDRQIDLFIRFCLQNQGRLSARKRASHFDALSDDEIARMEEAVQAAYGSATSAEE